MPRVIRVVILIFLVSLFISPSVFAATLQVTRIGTINTAGLNYKEWWYTGNNPVIVGLADPAAGVEIEIDGVKNGATADSAGSWSLKPAALGTGDHKVVVSSDGSELAFTIHIGQNLPENLLISSSSGLPVTGSVVPTLVVVSASALLLIAGILLGRKQAA